MEGVSLKEGARRQNYVSEVGWVASICLQRGSGFTGTQSRATHEANHELGIRSL